MLIDEPIITKRIYLKTLTDEYADGAYLKWMNDPEVMRYTESRFTNHTKEDLISYINSMNCSKENLLLGIFTIDQNRHIGNIKLGPIITHHDRADIGVIIGVKEYWSKGYAHEAVKILTDFAFNHLQLHRITAGVYEDNKGSLKLFHKLGYIEEARLRSYWKSNNKWVDGIILYRLSEQ
mgnify:CR=1 FL=1